MIYEGLLGSAWSITHPEHVQIAFPNHNHCHHYSSPSRIRHHFPRQAACHTATDELNTTVTSWVPLTLLQEGSLNTTKKANREGDINYIHIYIYIISQSSKLCPEHTTNTLSFSNSCKKQFHMQKQIDMYKLLGTNQLALLPYPPQTTKPF